jgi:hypothetical protein
MIPSGKGASGKGLFGPELLADPPLFHYLRSTNPVFWAERPVGARLTSVVPGTVAACWGRGAPAST